MRYAKERAPSVRCLVFGSGFDYLNGKVEGHKGSPCLMLLFYGTKIIERKSLNSLHVILTKLKNRQ